MYKGNLYGRLAAVGIALSLTLSMAACGGASVTDAGERQLAEETQADGSGTEDNKATENSVFDMVVAKLKEDINLYGYEEPIKFKRGFVFASDFTWAGNESFENNIWRDLYTEMGYDLEVLYNIDASQAETKLATAITSGNYPDLLSGSATEIVKYAETGVIADITDVFEEYASDQLKEYLNYGGIDNLSAGKVDGRIYGIPRASEAQIDGMMMFIRKDWLDKLGMEVPETMDELKEVAKAFTESDPDGDGTDDTYGLALCGKDGFTFWSGLQAFFEGYGAAPGYWSDNFTFIEKDGKVVWGGALADEMKAGLADLQEMYANGWLAKSFGTMDYNQLLSDIGSETCGIWFAPRWGAMIPYVDALKSNPEAEVVAAMIPDGMGEGSSKAYILTTPGTFFAISSKCEHPEAVVKLMNLAVRLMANYENIDEQHMFVGQTGVYSGGKSAWIDIEKPGNQIDMITKEIIVMKEGEGASTESLTEGMVEDVEKMRTFYVAKEDGTLSEKLAAGDAILEQGISSSTVYTETGGGHVMLQQIEQDRFNYSAYNTVPTEKMASCYSTLNKLALETIIKIICGESIDSYDTFLESWNSLGGEEVTKEAQNWYDTN